MNPVRFLSLVNGSGSDSLIPRVENDAKVTTDPELFPKHRTKAVPLNSKLPTFMNNFLRNIFRKMEYLELIYE
jgi:hypothetical protein